MLRELKLRLNNKNISVWVFAFIIMLLVLIGRAVDDGSQGGSKRSLAYAAVFGLLSWLIAYLIFHWFDCLTGSRVENGDSASLPLRQRVMSIDYWAATQDAISFTTSIKKYGLVCLIGVIFCWLPWVITCWPGVMRDDTIAQFMQSSGYHFYYTQHPLFDTLVFGFFWELGFALHHVLLGLGIYVLVQTFSFAIGVMLVLCYLRKIGAARSLLLAIFLFFAFCPAIVGAVPTMAKDSLHTVFLLPLSIIYVEIFLTRGKVLHRRPVCVMLVLLVALCMLSKRTATVAILCAFCVLVASVKKNRLKVVASMIIAMVLAQGIIEPALVRVTHAEVSPGKEVMGLIMMPVARIQSISPERISPQERSALSSLLNIDKAGKTYTNYRIDETSWTINNEASIAQKIKGIGAWVSLGVHNPGEYVKAFGNLMLGWFYPQVGVFYGSNSDGLFSDQYMIQWDSFVRPPLSAENVLHDMRGTGQKSSLLMRAADAGQQIAINPILNAYAYYATYIPLLLLIYGMSRKRWIAVGAGSLLGFNVLVLYLSPLVFAWYLLPVTFILPLFFGITGCIAEKQ